MHEIGHVGTSYYNSSSVCLCVCVCVCSLSPPRSFDGSSPKLVGVCRWTSHLPLRGSFSSKRSTGRRVNGSLSLSTILYMRQPHTKQLQKAPFALLLLRVAFEQKAPFAALHLNGVCRWTLQLPLRGYFSKTSTGRWVNGSNRSTGQRVTFTFTILYMIADDARLTPPRCKKHTAYDDTRLTPHHCKKHTASFARSTGKFPSH